MAATVGVSLPLAAQHESSDATPATSGGVAADDETSVCSARANDVEEESTTSGNEGDSDPDAGRATATSGILLQRVISRNVWYRYHGDNIAIEDRPETVSTEHIAADQKSVCSRSQSQYHSIQQLSRPSSNGLYNASHDLMSSERVLQDSRVPGAEGGGRRAGNRTEREEERRHLDRYDVHQLDVDNNNEQIDGEIAFYRRRMNGRRSINSEETIPSELSISPSVHYSQTVKDSTRTDLATRNNSVAEQIVHRKRMLSPTQSVAVDDDFDEPTMMMTSPSGQRASIQAGSSFSLLVAPGASECSGAAEAKRARVENIINSMQSITNPSPPETAAVDIYTSGPSTPLGDSSRHIDVVDGSADIVSDGPEAICSASAVPCSGTALETSDSLGQRRSNRRKQYVPQHQHMNSHTEHFRSFIERLGEHGHSDNNKTRQMDDSGRTDEDDNEQDGHISEEEAKEIQTAAVREGLRRVEQRLASMRQTFLGLARDDNVIIDIESNDAAEVCSDNVTSDFNRNEIRRLVAGSWFRSSGDRKWDELITSDENKSRKKQERFEGGIDDKVVRSSTNNNNNNNNNNTNNNQLEKLAAMLKAEISESVGSLVDDIVRTFIERYFDRRAANRKSAVNQEQECDHLRSGSKMRRTRDDGYSVSRYDAIQRQGTPRSPGTFSDDVSSGYVDEQTAEDEDRSTKLIDAQSESRSKSPGGTVENNRTSLPSVPKSDGGLPFPFPVSVGDEETMRESAARLVAYRQALAAAYLDSAFTQPNKTAFEVPRSNGHHQQVTLPPTTPSHRLFAPHPYYPTTGSRFDAHHATMTFVKVDCFACLVQS